jgi:putative lipoic acid-binding regulatory protein
MKDNNQNTLIEFPCYFPIKVMGEAQEDFTKMVVIIIKKYDKNFNESTIEIKGSSQGKYIGLTCNIYTTSKKQLDAIYSELSGLSITKFVL